MAHYFTVNFCGGGVLLSIGLILSCSVGNTPTTVKTSPTVEEVPAIISQPSESGGIESFQTQVKVYSSIDRNPSSGQLVSQYKLATKIIDGVLYTRLDFPADPAKNIAARTVVSNGSELVVLDPATGKIEHRIPVPAQTADLLNTVAQKPVSLFQKIDVAQLRKTYADLQWDIESNEDKTRWIIHYPVELLARYNVSSTQKLQSFKLYLDEASGTAVGYEQVLVEEDGTVVTTKSTTIYTEKDGTQIPIGIVQESHYDKPYTIDTSDSSLAPYNVETAPEVSAEEAAQLIESGQALAIDTMTGDPSDPDYTEQTITVYDSIELNTAPDILFKVF